MNDRPQQPGTSGSPPRRGSPRLPVILVAVGVLLLFANMGWFNWDFLLAISYLWPIALIGAGVDILLRGRYRLAVWIATLVFALAVYLVLPGGFGDGGPGAEEAVAQSLEGADRAEVVLSTGVAQLHVTSAERADLLAEGIIRPGGRQRIVRSFDVRDGIARFSLDSEGPTVRVGGVRGGSWELTLTGAVPLTLDVDTGVGQAQLDLGELWLSELELDTGVGAASVILPPGAYRAAFDTGVGALTVRVPAGQAVRVSVSRGIGAVAVPGSFTQIDDVYYSPEAERDDGAIDITVNSGIGAVDIELIR